jgi:hypothetical protein
MLLAQRDPCGTFRLRVFPSLEVGLVPPVSRDRARFEAELDTLLPEPHAKVHIFHVASKAPLVITVTFKKHRASHGAVGPSASVVGPLWLPDTTETLEELTKFGVPFFRGETEMAAAGGEDLSDNQFFSYSSSVRGQVCG